MVTDDERAALVRLTKRARVNRAVVIRKYSIRCPDRAAEEIERWARERHLPHVDGHAEFPDVRIEYDERDGRRGIEDVEVTTPHYRGAHAAAKARAGFTCYRGVGARVGGARLGLAGGGRRGGRGFDPRLAEEFVQ